MFSNKNISSVLIKYAQEQVNTKPVQRWRYYFYEAPPENSIKFSYLSEILKKDTPEKDALIKKLQGGNTGKFFADYFRWKKIYIATTQYSPDGTTIIVYTADLTAFGAKVAGSERIFPEGAAVTAETVENDLGLYNNKRGNSNIINIDTSGESLFSDQDPPANFEKVLVNRVRPAGKYIGYNDFSRIFDEYRIWSVNLNQLLLPTLEIPTSDGVPGGHYMGGQDSYNKLVGPYIKAESNIGEPKQESLMSKVDKEEEEKSPFQPVDEQAKDRVEGDYVDDTVKESPMVKKYSSEDMQRIKQVRNVIANYLADQEKEAEVSMTNTSTSTSTGIGKGTNTISKGLYQDAKKHDLAKKKLEQAARSIEQIGY